MLEIDSRESQHNRQRGYRLAFCELSALPDSSPFLALRPDIIKLSLDACGELLEQARSLNIAVEQSGIETAQDLARAGAIGIDLGQGSLFGPARTDCRPTHSGQRLAYNSPSSSGAEP